MYKTGGRFAPVVVEHVDGKRAEPRMLKGWVLREYLVTICAERVQKVCSGAGPERRRWEELGEY